MYHDAYQVYELLDKWNHQGPPQVDLMQQLFDEYPQEAERRFFYGQTLLHRAVESFPSHRDVVLCIFNAYPEALTIEDDNGFLVLHRLLFSGNWYHSHEIMALIPTFVEYHPDSVITRTSTGRLPLHLACQRTESESLVRYLLNSFPDAGLYRDDDEGKFPLDYALEVSNPKPDIVALLVQQHPVLLSYPDDQGCLPLHRLLKRLGTTTTTTYDSNQRRRRRGGGGGQTNYYDSVVQILLQAFPGCLRLEDGDGCTPLLRACITDSPLSMVYTLLRQWPEQVMADTAPIIFEDDPNRFNGELIHISLVSQTIELERVQLWLQRYPDMVISSDLYGRFPIHYAVASTSTDALEIVQLLLLHNSAVDDDEKDFNEERKLQQLTKADHDGLLPIHIAAATPCSSSSTSFSSQTHIIQLLINEFPLGLLQADKVGRLPWHYGASTRQDIVFDETVRLFPDVEVDLDLVVPEEFRFGLSLPPLYSLYSSQNLP